MLWAVLLMGQSTPAAAPIRVEQWTQAEGLPSDALQAAVTDGQGYLWVATSQGLARFDGRDWRTYDARNTPALGSNEVRNLLARSDGSLLVAMSRGRIVEYRHREFAVVADVGIPVARLDDDRKGAVLLAGSKIVRLRRDNVVETLLESGRVAESYVTFDDHTSWLALARSGEIIDFGAKGAAPGVVARVDDADAEGLLVLVDDDQTWLIGANARWRFDREHGIAERIDTPLGFRPVAAARGPDNWIWIGGRGDPAALCRMPSLRAAAPCEPVAGVAARNITNLQPDRSGALWISSWDAGLFRVTTPPIALFGPDSGVPDRTRTLLATADGAVLLGAKQALYRVRGDQVDPLPWTPLATTGDQLLSLAQLPDGRLLRGRYFGVDIASPPAYADWLPITATLGYTQAAYGLHVDAAGALWTSDVHTLRFDQKVWTEIDASPGVLYAYTVDREGVLWGAGFGAFRWGPGQRFVDAGAPRPPGRFILMSALTDSRGHVWFGGYETGLFRFDGKSWLHIDSARGLPDDTGYGVLEDDRERLWISHGRGLYTLALDEADRLARDSTAIVQVREYGSADGLPANGFNGGSGLAAVKDRSGLLWFVGDRGAVRLDPAQLPQPLAHPKVLIDALTIDGRPVRLGSHLQLPAGAQSVSVDVRAPAPGYADRIALRYRLDPMELEWRALPRSHLIEYQRLPPGSYRLRVQSAVDGLDWSDALDLAIEQIPHWWQRPVTWGLGAALLAVFGFGATRWRLAALRERNRRLERLVAERGDELANERVALAQAHSAQEEAERELLWLKRHRALEEWADVDATARAVYAALARSDAPMAIDAMIEQLCTAKPDDGGRWTRREVAAALDRLQARAAVKRDDDLRFHADRPDWALVPDLDLPLSDLITRAAPRIGAYRVLERVGEGAMGEVFRAVSVHDGNEAALKLVHRDASANPETRRRLEREGEIVSRLSHPNIVRLLERGEHDGRLYLAMEFLRGETLHACLNEPATLDTRRAIRILLDLASALSVLHELGVIHRDLHPGNVLVLADGTAKLLDFGLARAAATSTITRADTVIGNLPYLAPEIVAGKPASAASDLFALGVIGCECLSGKRLWQSTQTLELIVEIARFEGLDQSQLQGLDAPIRTLMHALLDPNPTNRGTAASAAAALRGWLGPQENFYRS